MKGKLCQALVTIVTILICSNAARASVIQVGSSGALGANDNIVWSSLGGDLTSLSSPTSLTTTGGISATLTGSSAFTLFSGSTYNADFLPGNTVVSAFDSNTFTPLATGIQINFGTAIFGIGGQIQVDAFTSFKGTLEAFNASMTSLGSVFLDGTVLGNGDGSAPFLGLTSTVGIYAIRFTADQAGVAINDLGIVTTGPSTAVPEPSSIALLLPALLTVFVWRRHSLALKITSHRA
jgi:hypothetical protein